MHGTLNQSVIYKVPHFKLTSTKLVTWFRLEGYARRQQEHPKSLANLKDNKTKGKFSQKASKRMKSVIDNWISAVEFKIDRDGKTNSEIAKYLTFVTLTLSATQVHDDKEIRRHMLGDFLRKIKEKHGVRNYLYCSEAQENGNIHFHIVVDRYIHHQLIRSNWNQVQDNYGYLDRFEALHLHRNPNSTDIHSFRKVRSISNYLVKYFTKDQGRRPIEGHLWGCSEGLKDLEVFKDLVDSRCDQLLDALPKFIKDRAYHDDWFSVYNFGNFRDLKRVAIKLWKYISEFYCEQFSQLYGIPIRPTPPHTIWSQSRKTVGSVLYSNVTI